LSTYAKIRQWLTKLKALLRQAVEALRT
jgi:hypothetical protein